MRLSFPSGERDEVQLSQRSFTVGSGQSDDIYIAHESVTNAHAIILMDQRGIVLLVTQANSATVNNRPVVSKAILRPGDSIRLGEVEALLRSSASADLNDELSPNTQADVGQGALRFSGLFSFRAIDGCDNGRSVAVTELATDQLKLAVLKEQGLVSLEADDEVAINGNLVRSGILRPGDQLVIGQRRWLLDAASFVPGRDYVGHQPEQFFTEQTATEPRVAPRQRNELLAVGGTLVLAVVCLIFLLAR